MKKLQLKIAVIALAWMTAACASAPVEAQQSGLSASVQNAFASVYTDMKNDCKVLPEPPDAPEGGDPLGACKGYGDYQIVISYSAWGAALRAENSKNSEDSIPLGEDYGSYGDKGEKVEWRMADGKPFAVILRVGKYKESRDGGNPFAPANRTGSKLLVKGLKGWEHIGFEVDGATANANQKARQLADENYSKK